MRRIHRDIVSALIFSQDGKLFMGMKDPNKGGVYADCWHIPGGGIDDGEDKLIALAREIMEETGIDIKNEQIELVDDTGTGKSTRKLKDTGEVVECDMSFNVYKVTLHQKSEAIEVDLNDDLVRYEWVDVTNLGDYKLTPPSVKLFSKLGYLK